MNKDQREPQKKTRGANAVEWEAAWGVIEKSMKRHTSPRKEKKVNDFVARKTESANFGVRLRQREGVVLRLRDRKHNEG